MFAFLLGLFIGCCLGVILLGLLTGSRSSRDTVFQEGETGGLPK